MSGTPVENRLSEYWSIMDFANRGYLGKLPQFVKEYAVPIQTHRDQQVVERFRRVTAPFLLRRLKSDRTIIDDLPDKIEQDQYCTLSAAQSALYESVVQEGLRSHRRRVGHFPAPGSGAADDSGAEADLQPSGAVPQAGPGAKSSA
jgi:SNF2 family DNA or RNA helicase